MREKLLVEFISLLDKSRGGRQSITGILKEMVYFLLKCMIFKREKKLNTVFERKGSVSGQVFAWGLNKEMDVFLEIIDNIHKTRFDN